VCLQLTTDADDTEPTAAAAAAAAAATDDDDGEEEETEAEMMPAEAVDADAAPLPVPLVSSSGLPLISVRSSSCEWTDEEMQLDWSEQLSVHQLQLLRDFFIEGMNVNVVEEKVLVTLC